MIFLPERFGIDRKAVNMDDGKSFLIDGRSVPALLAVLAAAAFLSVALASGLGPVSVPPDDTFMILLSRLPFAGDLIEPAWSAANERIVMNLRLPRVLLGMTVGASLAVTGVAMQALVRNHLADRLFWASRPALRPPRRSACSSALFRFSARTRFR